MRSLFASLVVPAALVGCASSAVVVGKARPPISPDAVKLYLTPPKNYEQIALVEATSRSSFSFTDQGKTNAVVDRLKSEAAKLGANGILLQGTGSVATGTVSNAAATTDGHAAVASEVTASMFQKTGNGIAIYVVEE